MLEIKIIDRNYSQVYPQLININETFIFRNSFMSFSDEFYVSAQGKNVSVVHHGGESLEQGNLITGPISYRQA